MCNKEVKFGAFLKKALAMGADFVATGHYAINENSKNFHLLQSKDSSKDQSYFLWTLTQKQLSKIIFPIGNLKKTDVRKLARKFDLPVAEKKDSQGICFLGAVDLKEFLKHYIKPKKGEVVLVPSEAEGEKKKNVIGWHNGVVFHTLGERHGFTITKKSPTDSPYYIVGKDVKKNILFVSQDKNCLAKSTDIFLHLENINWINEIPKSNKTYTAQIRYHGELLSCQIKIRNKTSAEVVFTKPVMVASGQSIVIYDKDICLGGGVVS
jgi:tRNA-specific 2-thiouridylase